MKILFVSPLYPSSKNPHYCIFIQQQAQALNKLGHNVDVIVPRDSMCKRGIEKTSYCGISVIYVDYPKFYKGLFNDFSIKMFNDVVCKNIDVSSYDIISVHLAGSHMIKAWTILAHRFGKKIIVHFHGLNVGIENSESTFIDILLQRDQKSIKKTISQVDGIVGVSNEVCKRAREHYEVDIIRTVYNGVDTEIFYPAEKLIEPGEIKILCVGNLIPIKGHKYLFEGIHLFAKKHPDIKINIDIVGDGIIKADLIDYAKKLNLEKIVSFLGAMPYEQVATRMRLSDIFIMPSYYEALGCVYLEAMASSIIAVGCEGQGISEIIINGDNGFLVRPQDSKGICEVLEYIVDSPLKAKEIAYKGYKTVVENYTYLDSAKQLEAVYRELILR